MLRKAELFTNVLIDEDLSEAFLEIEKTLWNVNKKGTISYAKIFIWGHYVIVNECKYNIDSLPDNLKPKQV